jgi:hypothetical protein
MLKSNNQPSIKVEESFYTIGVGAVCLAHSNSTKYLYDKIAAAYTAQDIPSDNVLGSPSFCYLCTSLIAGSLEKDTVNQTRLQ